MSEALENIVVMLNDLKTDSGVPKNIKTKLNEIIDILNSDSEKSIKVDKVMHIFDAFNDDSNIDPFTRTQLWNVLSMLESL